MDRLLREGNPPAGQLASPKPQYKKPGVDEYAPVEGQHGAPFAILKDASGNVVSPATEAKLEQVRALLSGVATEAKLEQARVLLNSINSKDFATASKQDALNTVVEDLKSELALVKAELQAIKANQLSGDQKVLDAIYNPTMRNPVTGIKTVTATAAEVFAGASRLNNRRRMIIKNEDPILRCRIGSSSVSQQNGFPLEPGATIEMEFEPGVTVPIYAISEGASLQLAVIEL
jgi:hypothetical protein